PRDFGYQWHLSDVQHGSSTRGHRIPFHIDEDIAFNRLDIKIKRWKRHWQNTMLCFPDKVKQFKEEVKRERRVPMHLVSHNELYTARNERLRLGVDPRIRRGPQMLSTDAGI
ncbi:hypothetical protein WG66_007505, partial [Moniliophthora roreri]